LKRDGDKLAGVQALPELLVLDAVGVLGLTEYPVMFALDLRQAVAHAIEETVVGRQHIPVEVKLDHGGGAHQRSDQVFVFPGCFDGARQVAGVHRKMLDAPIAAAHRLHDGAQPGLVAVAPRQAHGTGVMFATHQGVFEAQLKGVLPDVRRYQFFDQAAWQLAGLVGHLLQKDGVDGPEAPIRVQGQGHHFAFQALLDLLQAGQFFAKSGQLLLEAGVEHGRHRGQIRTGI